MTTSLLSGRWRAVAALATVTLLAAAAACKHTDDAAPPKFGVPKHGVWAIDVRGHQANNRQATWVGDRHQATLQLTVYATVCPPEVKSYDSSRGGGYGHNRDFCPVITRQSTVDELELDQSHPHLRVRELTATAHVQIVAEHGSQRVHAFPAEKTGRSPWASRSSSTR